MYTNDELKQLARAGLCYAIDRYEVGMLSQELDLGLMVFRYICELEHHPNAAFEAAQIAVNNYSLAVSSAGSIDADAMMRALGNLPNAGSNDCLPNPQEVRK